MDPGSPDVLLSEQDFTFAYAQGHNTGIHFNAIIENRISEDNIDLRGSKGSFAEDLLWRIVEKRIDHAIIHALYYAYDTARQRAQRKGDFPTMTKKNVIWLTTICLTLMACMAHPPNPARTWESYTNESDKLSYGYGIFIAKNTLRRAESLSTADDEERAERIEGLIQALSDPTKSPLATTPSEAFNARLLDYIRRVQVFFHEIEATGFDLLNKERFIQGFGDELRAPSNIPKEKLKAVLKALNEKISAYLAQNHRLALEKAQQEEDRFLGANAKREGIQTTNSGLQYKVLQPSTSSRFPGKFDKVRATIEGRWADGSPMEENGNLYDGHKLTVTLDHLYPGLSEGLRRMSEGAVFKLWLPFDLVRAPRGLRDPSLRQAAVFTVALEKVTQRYVYSTKRYGQLENLFQPMVDAISAESIEDVALLIQGGYDVNQTGMKTDTETYTHSALHLAAGGFGPEEAMVEIVKRLVDAGAKVNQLDGDSEAPLSMAIRYGHYKIARQLIDYGARATVGSGRQWSALHSLCDAPGEGATELLRQLVSSQDIDLEARSNSGDTPLMYCLPIHPEKSRILVAAGAKTNVQSDNGRTLAMNAILKAWKPEQIQLLAELGIDWESSLQARTDAGNTLFHMVALSKSPSAIAGELCAALSPALNMIRKDDYTPLDIVLQHNLVPFLDRLQDCGYALSDYRDKEDRNLLARLIVRTKDLMRDDSELIRYLIEAGISVTAFDKQGYNAMMHAIAGNKASHFEALKQHYPDVTLENPQGLSAIDLIEPDKTLKSTVAFIRDQHPTAFQ